MADTFTPKLGLRQYDATLNYQVSKFSADNLLIDNAIGTIICTSTTRPSTGLFNGMQLWETDTQRFVVRVAGAWVAASANPIIVANQAARDAIVTKYDGQTVYRQDRDWIETYDGAAWRVVGIAHCTSTADRDSAITSPYNGQKVITTDTGSTWIRQGGSWVRTVLVLEAVQSTAVIGMTGTAQDLTGATLTFSTFGTNREVLINATIDGESNGTTDIGIVTCVVDGATQSGELHWGPSGRASYGRNWRVVLAASGSHTIKLQGRRTGSTNTFSTYSSHTNIVATVFHG